MTPTALYTNSLAKQYKNNWITMSTNISSIEYIVETEPGLKCDDYKQPEH